MPSPVIHIGYSLGYGSLIMTSTKGSFTAIHCLLLSLNSFIGPDIGSFINWCFTYTFPLIADKAMTYIHDTIGYIVIISPIISILSSILSKKLIYFKYKQSLNNDIINPNIDEIDRNQMGLNIKDCYLLSISGCLLHFQLDYIFEENGENYFYKWILSTGYFQRPTPPLSLLSVIFVGLSTLILFFGFAWIHLFSSHISKQSLITKLKYTFCLFFFVFSVYFSFLFISQIIFKKKALIGEEADLGVLVFIIAFYFLPFLLCLLSISN